LIIRRVAGEFVGIRRCGAAVRSIGLHGEWQMGRRVCLPLSAMPMMRVDSVARSPGTTSNKRANLNVL
jgi:hypothetical protein